MYVCMYVCMYVNQRKLRPLFVSPCPPECHFQSETKIEPDLRLLPYKKWLLFSNFQVQRDSPSATKNGYLLCLNRRYIIHFQYSIRGFVILELTKSREWVLSTLVGQKRPFLLLTGHPTSIALRTDSKNTLRLIKPLAWLRQTLLLTRRLHMRVYRVLSQNIAFFAYFYRDMANNKRCSREECERDSRIPEKVVWVTK